VYRKDTANNGFDTRQNTDGENSVGKLALPCAMKVKRLSCAFLWIGGREKLITFPAA
jgi:hypothetical protein